MKCVLLIMGLLQCCQREGRCRRVDLALGTGATGTWRPTSESFDLQAHWVDQLVATGTAQAARFLESAVAAGLSVLVSGGTQAGNPTSW